MITSMDYNSGNSICKNCGKQNFYVGDIPEGGFLEGFEPFCTCNNKKNNSTKNNYGWICPKCGKSLSPYILFCDCNNDNFKITY